MNQTPTPGSPPKGGRRIYIYIYVYIHIKIDICVYKYVFKNFYAERPGTTLGQSASTVGPKAHPKVFLNAIWRGNDPKLLALSGGERP